MGNKIEMTELLPLKVYSFSLTEKDWSVGFLIIGLFTGDLGPIPTKKLFRGMLFLLTNVDKSAEQRKQEKELLQDSSLETSTGESAGEGMILSQCTG